MNNRDMIAIRICLALLVALCAYVVWATQLDGVLSSPPATYWAGSFQTTKDTYHRGDPVSVRVIVSKTRNIPGHISWTLVNIKTGESFRYEPKESHWKAGEYDHTVHLFDIPAYVSPGIYRGMGYTAFDVNGLKTVTYRMETNEFSVVNGD